MPGNNHGTPETAPPHAQLVQMAMAHWVSHIVYVAAKLSVADYLANGAKLADELAGPTGTRRRGVWACASNGDRGADGESHDASLPHKRG